jgi:hypothetical protein
MRVATSLLAASLGLVGCVYHHYPAPSPGPAPTSQPAPAATTEEQQPATRANCREVTQTITIDGKDVQATGTACQQPDGKWRFN